jgi:hypothetical protein
MDYLYENLGDEGFQQFCSALISKEFPDIQSFPVGQPDGGRDSVSYITDYVKKEFIVFQVKFVRNANQERDIHQWLTETIKGEINKIKELIPRGAIKYYLLTNVRGTAHLDSGSKDKVNKILEDNIEIPSICWWRDDISTLFEKDPIFKWSFPEVLDGQTILNSFAFEGLQEQKERRERVVKAYLADQFEIDNEVKFKQIDLQNRLLTLFTDVPLQVKMVNPKNKQLRYLLYRLNLIRNSIGNDGSYPNHELLMPAADFFLNSEVQRNVPRVLLEGGPGQGKSTISQYVCQVHRARLLNMIGDIDLLPENHRHAPTRIPFKIDLRDLASYVEKKTPYGSPESQDAFLTGYKASLEAFLVMHVHYHSKEETFNSSDLLAICKASPILFVFDGFDEIANLQVRSDVIEFINRGITRLSANSKSIQVFVTSRPAAFSDSVGFSIETYPHFELAEITTPVINEYVEKWIKSSKLDTRDASSLRKLIREKLDMPHLKDLAKSPMQLAIFISLLRTKGESLPNKRTALYDNYIDLFFDREAEKNPLIRDKRDLIIDIHQYLAWVLHSEAESEKNSGRIFISDLNLRLKTYLNNEGHDSSIADQLFNVMKERVCALVSRVQGTFEFEVQPLREYFCAKYLYKSAPHSSAGKVSNGAKPDRFNGILRSFYWQNVVRFFAGCADAGELDMIIQEIKDLQNDSLLKYTDYPRIITAQILSDYVFTQKPLKLKEVVKIIVDGINIQAVINQDNGYSSNEALFIPNDCGRKEVIEECFSQLNKYPNYDISNELIAIINNNPLNKLEYWLGSVLNYKGEKLTIWLEYGYRLGLIYQIEESLLMDIINEASSTMLSERLQIIVNGNRQEIFENDYEIKTKAFDYILNNELIVIETKKANYSLTCLSIFFYPLLISHVMSRVSNDIFLERIVSAFQTETNRKPIFDFNVADNIDQDIKIFFDTIKPATTRPIKDFTITLEPWDLIVESARKIFGERLIFDIYSVIVAGVKIKESVEDYSNFDDNSISLVKRLRFARLKSGSVKFWEALLMNKQKLLLKLMMIFTFATPKTIFSLFDELSNILKNLDDELFSQLKKSLTMTSSKNMFTKAQENEICSFLKSKVDFDEMKFILSLRFSSDNTKFVYENIIKSDGKLKSVIDIKYIYLITLFLKKPDDEDVLEQIRQIYPNINRNEDKYYHYRYLYRETSIPYDLAKKIMINPKDFPSKIVTSAERSCRLFAGENVVPVGKVAIEEKWFE